MSSQDPRKATTGVFPGSFNPFTKGHDDIVRRALAVFDRVVIVVGVNINKPEEKEGADQRADHIRQYYADTPQVGVECWNGLTSDFVKQIGADAIIRGIRNVKDFEYERDMADANRMISGVDTVMFMCDPQYACLSSSLVRELQAYGKDVSDLIV